MAGRISKTVLGIRIDDVSLSAALALVNEQLGGGPIDLGVIEKRGEMGKGEKIGKVEKVEENGKREKDWFLEKSVPGKIKSFLIVTPGPEFLLTAQDDKDFAKILNGADLSLPDGFGLQLYGGIKNRVPGTDFMVALCQLAAKNNWTIGLLGGLDGVAVKAAENLRRQFPEIKIALVVDGAAADRILSGSDTIYNSKKKIDVLFAAFGHPRQEKLLWRLKGRYRVGMGVGGAFDYIAGAAFRPPKLLQTIGLEWLWRLIFQPWRLGRIFKATIVFPLYLLLKRS